MSGAHSAEEESEPDAAGERSDEIDDMVTGEYADGSDEHGSIRLDGLRKEFDDVIAVKNVDLTIRSGEFLTLLGPSGCGKSTTLRMVSGLETPTDGTVHISGEDVTDTPANRRDTTLVFQEWALFPHMTVEENVSFGLEMDDVPKDERERRVNDALELVELPGYNDRKATELSGGQKQRVAMARAIVREPDVLLLDEPLASLDRKLRQHMQVELKQIQEELGITFLYVTHDQEEALTMSDRIAVMNDGQLEQVGPTTELYEHPQTTFVATFLGETNLFEGHLEADGSDAVLRADTGIDVRVSGYDDEAGREAAVAVRPEKTKLAARGELDQPNRWDGEVTETIYKGSTQQYFVDIGSNEFHVVRQLDETERTFDEGESVTVGFSTTAGELVLE